MANVTRGQGMLENFLSRRRERRALRLIPAGARQGRLLDLGCGRIPRFLSRAGFAEAVGVDARVVVEPPYPAGVRLVELDLESDQPLPFESHSFRVVTMLAVLEHLTVEGAAFRSAEARRLLQPGGRFIVTTPAAWTGFLLRGMARLRLVSAVETGEHQTTYTPERLRRLLTGAGFDEAGIRVGGFEWGMNLWAAAEKTDD